MPTGNRPIRRPSTSRRGARRASFLWNAAEGLRYKASRTHSPGFQEPTQQHSKSQLFPNAGVSVPRGVCVSRHPRVGGASIAIHGVSTTLNQRSHQGQMARVDWFDETREALKSQRISRDCSPERTCGSRPVISAIFRPPSALKRHLSIARRLQIDPRIFDSARSIRDSLRNTSLTVV